MEVKKVPANHQIVYLKSAAQQMGFELLANDLLLPKPRWGGQKKCLTFSVNGETVEVIGYGLPETAVIFCSHLEHAYGKPVKLEFRYDHPVDAFAMRYF